MLCELEEGVNTARCSRPPFGLPSWALLVWAFRERVR